MIELFRSRPVRPEGFVFICTYGRSGSTLLMGLLNSIPHYMIRGENNGTLYRLFEAWKALRHARDTGIRNSERPTHPWYGLHQTDLEAFGTGLRDLFVDTVLKPSRHHRVTGFKEIRFSEKQVPDLEDYLAFLSQVFAPAKIIFNHRDIDDVAASKWWSSMPRARERIAFMDERFRAVPASDSVFHFEYDRIMEGDAHLRALFAFLGEPYRAEAVEKVLKTRHSY